MEPKTTTLNCSSSAVQCVQCVQCVPTGSETHKSSANVPPLRVTFPCGLTDDMQSYEHTQVPNPTLASLTVQQREGSVKQLHLHTLQRLQRGQQPGGRLSSAIDISAWQGDSSQASSTSIFTPSSAWQGDSSQAAHDQASRT